MSTTIAIQGIAGSFHHQAAEEFFGKNIKLVESTTFRDVFTNVQDGSANYGVVAVENSLHGSINSVYRLLAREKLWVMGEIRLKIELFLIGNHKTFFTDSFVSITRLLSQLPAFEQCELWLHENLPHASLNDVNDTADGVRYVTRHKQQENYAAIAGKQAADLYGGKILAGPINDDPDNYTRFFILSKKPLVNAQASRTSIIISEKQTDKAGTLYHALGIFKAQGINLSKLDSHPLPGKKRRYSFYIDFDTSSESESGRYVLNMLADAGWDVTVLGSYPAQ